MNPQAEHLLKDHQLRLTDARVAVLETFFSAAGALSHADLEKELDAHFDRVTIYRTLSTFMEKGLLHKVPVDDGGTRYALCHDHCTVHTHLDDHIHFKCSQCGTTSCLEELQAPKINLPTGYKADEYNFLVVGVCKACNGRS
ncbi:MAG: Fur family transcriptional regulator [Chitinophagales bacterium]|nr:Fur family transcriptional regulator [Chitinophagales bacterium]